jgi:hypothetical protein
VWPIFKTLSLHKVMSTYLSLGKFRYILTTHEMYCIISRGGVKNTRPSYAFHSQSIVYISCLSGNFATYLRRTRFSDVLYKCATPLATFGSDNISLDFLQTKYNRRLSYKTKKWHTIQALQLLGWVVNFPEGVTTRNSFTNS